MYTSVVLEPNSYYEKVNIEFRRQSVKAPSWLYVKSEVQSEAWFSLLEARREKVPMSCFVRGIWVVNS